MFRHFINLQCSSWIKKVNVMKTTDCRFKTVASSCNYFREGIAQSTLLFKIPMYHLLRSKNLCSTGMKRIQFFIVY
jgi:hypothetical protein